MGWSKRETCLELYKLVLQYLRALRGFNHRFNGEQTATGICDLTMKLIDETKWQNQALNFKKLIAVQKAFKTAFEILSQKGRADHLLVENKSFQEVIKIYEKGLETFEQALELRKDKWYHRSVSFKKETEKVQKIFELFRGAKDNN